MFNDIGAYGSEISPLSARNDIATTPPAVYVRGKAVMWVTTNELLSRVHPDVLRAMLRN